MLDALLMWIYHVVLFYPAQDGGCGIGARPLILCAGSRRVMGGLWVMVWGDGSLRIFLKDHLRRCFRDFRSGGFSPEMASRQRRDSVTGRVG